MNTPARPTHRPDWISADSGDFDLSKQHVAQGARPEDVPQHGR